MNKPIYTMTDAELQAENNSLRHENDRLCKALADLAEERDELKAKGIRLEAEYEKLVVKYGGLIERITRLAQNLEKEEKRHAGGRKSGGAGAGMF